MAVLTWYFLPSLYWKEAIVVQSPELSIPIEPESLKCKIAFVKDRWMLETDCSIEKSFLLKVSTTPGECTSSYRVEIKPHSHIFYKIDSVSGLELSKFFGLVELDFDGDWPAKEVMFSVDGAAGDCKITSGIRMCTHTMILKEEDTASCVQKTFWMHTNDNVHPSAKTHSFKAEMKTDSNGSLEILIGGYDDNCLQAQRMKLWLLDASGKEIYSVNKALNGEVDGKRRFHFDDAMINNRRERCLSPELTLKIQFFMVEMEIISNSGLLFNPIPSAYQQLKEKETCIADVSDLCRILKIVDDNKSMAIEWLAQHEREVITSDVWKVFIDSHSRLAAEALNDMCLKKLAPPTKRICK